MSSQQEYPVVMRMQGMWPESLGGFERHRRRLGGDLGHVDGSRSVNNKRLIGSANWAQDAWDEIGEMRSENHLKELERLKKRRRKAELERRLAEGPRDPWRATRHGPMREIILTVNKRWFDDDLTEFLGDEGPTRKQQFEQLATAWLINRFGENCVHARADLDEEAYHIHAVILPRARTKDGRRMLQPSKHAMIRSYEEAQDDVGAWFSQIGLKRGEKRKQAIRDAIEHNKVVREAELSGSDDPGERVRIPQHRKHVSPRKWREEQDRKLADREMALQPREDALDEREEAMDAREERADSKEAEAGAVLDIAAEVAEGRTDVGSDSPEENVPCDGRKAAKAGLAARIFGQALTTLRAKARDEAHAELAKALDEVKAADAAIVEIAALLPESARRKIAEARRSLTRHIVALSRRTQDWLGSNKGEDPRE